MKELYKLLCVLSIASPLIIGADEGTFRTLELHDISLTNELSYAIWVREPSYKIDYTEHSKFSVSFPEKWRGSETPPISRVYLLVLDEKQLETIFRIPIHFTNVKGVCTTEFTIPEELTKKAKLVFYYGDNPEAFDPDQIQKIATVVLNDYMRDKPYQTAIRLIYSGIDDPGMFFFFFLDELENGRWNDALESIEMLKKEIPSEQKKAQDALRYIYSYCSEYVRLQK